MTDTTDTNTLMALTAQIVSAHLSHNAVAPDQVQKLIHEVHQALGNITKPPEIVSDPAVPIKQSVRPDAILCLECGKPFSMLKRHLNTDHKMTPDDYRKKWGLPVTYSMTAPNYTKVRSALAKKIGLGRPKGSTQQAKPPVPAKKAVAKRKAARR